MPCGSRPSTCRPCLCLCLCLCLCFCFCFCFCCCSRVPVCSGVGRGMRPLGEHARMRARFRQHRTCCRKPLLADANPKGAAPGVAFSLVSFSWRIKRKRLGRRRPSVAKAWRAAPERTKQLDKKTDQAGRKIDCDAEPDENTIKNKSTTPAAPPDAVTHSSSQVAVRRQVDETRKARCCAG